MEESGEQKIDWKQIERDYRADKGSCKVLALKYGVKPALVSDHCYKGNWNLRKAQIVKRAEEVAEKTIVSALVSQSKVWVDETLGRMKERRQNIDASIEQMQPAMDPALLLSVCRAEQVVNDVARQSLGLKDDKASVTVNVAVSQQVLSSFDCVKKLNASGELAQVVVDLEELRTAELEDD